MSATCCRSCGQDLWQNRYLPRGERKEWVAIAKLDDRVSGDDPLIGSEAGTAVLPDCRADPRLCRFLDVVAEPLPRRVGLL